MKVVVLNRHFSFILWNLKTFLAFNFDVLFVAPNIYLLFKQFIVYITVSFVRNVT
jgi:hypothetical protein